VPGWLTLFATIFAVVFLVELPDKTALATVVLATRHRPLPVFAGVALAFVVQSVVAVFAGSLIAFLPQQVVRVGAGLLFIAMAAVIVWRTRRQATAEKNGELPRQPRGRERPFVTAFSMIMLAEWGDLSQLATVAFQARYNEGLRLYRDEKLEQAIMQWRSVLDLDPRHPSARKNIEQAEQILKKLEERTRR